MMIRTLAIPALLAATLALGVTGTARADHGQLSIHYDSGHDDCPRYSHDYGYYSRHRDRHHGRHGGHDMKHARKHVRKHLKRHHKVHGRGHDHGHHDEHSRIGIGYTGHL